MAKILDAHLQWDQGLHFTSTSGNNNFVMDSTPPLGTDKGVSPKQALLASIAGCSAMDVASLMKKYRQPEHTFEIKISGPLTEGYPAVFSEINIDYIFEGAIDPSKAIEAIRLSMTKYCGVTAMIVKACPVKYKVLVNKELVAEDQAKFS